MFQSLRRFSLFIFILSVLAAPLASLSYDKEEMSLKADELPKELEQAGIKEQLGDSLDLNLKFTDDKGETVALKKYFASGKPVILSLVYYSCPNLCNFHLNGLNDAMRKLKLSIGKDYHVVAVSFDHRESYKTAAEKKKNYLKAYGRVGAEEGWHFLTGSEENLKALAKSVGFSFRWDENSSEWAHSSAAILITPEGQISRYLHGVHFEQKDLRLALLETADGKIGNFIDGIILYCFRFDPKKNKYTLYAYNIMKAGATATVILMALFLFPVWLREKREKVRDGHQHNS